MSNAVQLDITWDPVKAQSNVAKHGVTFVQAATVLHDALALTVFDAAHSELEERWFTLGTSGDGKLLAVSHTFKQARRADPCARAHHLRTRGHQARAPAV